MATDASPAKSAERALDILEYVARSPGRVAFPELAKELGIPKSSLFNLLNMLIKRKYLEKSDLRGGYNLGSAIEELSLGFGRAGSLVGRAVRRVQELAESLNETSGYYERRGDLVECLVAEVGRHPLIYNMRVGERVPLFANSCGKALLAAQPDEEIRSYISRTDFRPYTKSTILNGAALMADIRRIRKLGYGRSNGEYLPGIIAVAKVVHENGLAVGALNVVVPEIRSDEASLERVLRALEAAATRFEGGEARTDPAAASPLSRAAGRPPPRQR
jgi:DNA-binding IclR family transcriptional regulator